MKLSDFEGQFFHVVKEGSFDTLGILVSEPNKPYLCFAESEIFLSNACDKEDVTCIICTQELSNNEKLLKSGKGIAVCTSPRTIFYQMHNWLGTNDKKYIGERAINQIGKNCNIHPTAIIAESGVCIGDNVTIEEYAVVRAGTTIGNNVVVRSGAIIGGANQIVCHDENGDLFLVAQIGNVKIGNDNEIAYHALVACGMFPYEVTSIGDHCCIDTDVVIAHNCQINNNVMVLAQAQVCGSTTIGENVRVSPHAIVSNCLSVASDVTVSIGSVVVNNVKKGLKVSGNFAIEHGKFLMWHRKKNRQK